MPAHSLRILSFAMGALLAPSAGAFAQSGTYFTPGNLVVMVEGCGVHGGTCTGVPSGTGSGASYGDQQAAPITLFQYTPSGTASVTFVNSLQLPQTASGANLPISGEFGSGSEGTLHLSGAGEYLTLIEYGINAATFDAAYYPGFTADPYGAAPSGDLAQSGSLTGQSYTPVPRVVALIDANGNVNTATAIENIFNTENPRSAYTLNGTTAYVSGQGTGTDATGGVFYVPLDAATTAPTAITGLDTDAETESQDTRDVQIYNDELYVSVDTTAGTGTNRDYIGNLGLPPATSLYNDASGPTELSGFGTSTGKVTITSGTANNGNGLNAGLEINLSPENYFFASPSVLYVADSGQPKNSSATSPLGDGGLQKWINSEPSGTGTWSLAYTLYSGLNLVKNSKSSGVTGLYGLAGVVNGATVQLYATSDTLYDLNTTFLYGTTDTLAFTTPTQAAAEAFTILDTAPADSNFRGVALAPSIPAGTVEILSSPSGFSFTTSGTGCAAGTYTTPISLAWTPGSACTLQAAAAQSDKGVPYTFLHWQNGSTSTRLSVTAPSTTATYTATFAESSSTHLTASPNPAGTGQTVTLSATVTGPGTSPTGTVNFTVNGLSLGMSNVNSGVATLTAGSNGIMPGTYPVVATYSGDSNYAGSESAALDVILTKAAISTALAVSPNPVTPPATATLTATVKRTGAGAAGTPTGTVTFYDQATALATATLNASGVATFSQSTNGIAAGQYAITAKYNGDSYDSVSTSPPVTVTVQ